MQGSRSTGQRGGGYYASPPSHFSSGAGQYHSSGGSPTVYPGPGAAGRPRSRNVGGAGVDRYHGSLQFHRGSDSLDEQDDGYEQTRVYLEPPRPRNDASQARLWSAGYMRPFTPPTTSGRNVECCIPVKGDDGIVRPCGATLKHNLGMHGLL